MDKMYPDGLAIPFALLSRQKAPHSRHVIWHPIIQALNRRADAKPGVCP